jgi:hypothetical protein
MAWNHKIIVTIGVHWEEKGEMKLMTLDVLELPVVSERLIESSFISETHP